MGGSRIPSRNLAYSSHIAGPLRNRVFLSRIFEYTRIPQPFTDLYHTIPYHTTLLGDRFISEDPLHGGVRGYGMAGSE